MIPNIRRGSSMAGLINYLVGPGRHNEHTEPHLVSGDEALMLWFGHDQLDADAGRKVARHLDRPKRATGVDVPRGHVWHCSLSLAAREGQIGDDKWREIAQDFITLMGFDDQEGSRHPCRWTAVHHGVSANGNDHIHLVVDLVREDGTKADVHNDFRRAQQACRALEVEHGLEALESASLGLSTKGWKPGELEAQARRRAEAKWDRERITPSGVGPVWDELEPAHRQELIGEQLDADQPRHLIAAQVRGCAAASATESEFVRRLRRAQLIVRPRYAAGRTDVVVGYSVARRPRYGERPIWYSGTRLANDLTLPRLRRDWPDSAESATAAVAEWTAGGRGRRPVAPGRELNGPADPSVVAEQTRVFDQLIETLRDVPVQDRAQWAEVARRSAGVLASMAQATGELDPELAEASRLLSISAQVREAPVKPRSGWVASSLIQAAMLTAVAARGGRGVAAQALMIRSVMKLVDALADTYIQEQRIRHAAALRDDVNARLGRVHERISGLSIAEVERRAAARRAQETQLNPDERAALQRLRAVRQGTTPVIPQPPVTPPNLTSPGHTQRPGNSRGR